MLALAALLIAAPVWAEEAQPPPLAPRFIRCKLQWRLSQLTPPLRLC